MVRESLTRAVAEIVAITAIFAAAGAWPVPDTNEAVYLAKARHAADPSWIAGDFFLETPDAHGVFYVVMGPLAGRLSLEATVWIGRMAGWLALALGFHHLARATVLAARGKSHPWPFSTWPSDGKAEVFHARRPPHCAAEDFSPGLLGVGWSTLRRTWALLVAAAIFSLALRQTHAAGEWVIGGCEAKVFAWALVFGGLGELVRNRFKIAWCLLGAATAFHPIVGGWAMLASLAVRVFMTWPPEPRSPIVRGTLITVGCVLAAVGVIPALLLNAGVDAATRQLATRIYVVERLPHHLLMQTFATGFVARHFLAAVVWWMLSRMTPPSEARGRLTAFTLVALGISLSGAVIEIAQPWLGSVSLSLLRFYWFRLGDVAVPLALAIFAAAALADDGVSRRLAPLSPGMLRMVVTLLLALDLATESKHWPLPGCTVRPRADSKVDATAWADICAWVRDHTPADACFLTPRGAATFGWRTDRREVVSWKNSPQDAASLVAWRERIIDCFSWDGTMNDLARSTASLGEERLRAAATCYGATHAIVPRDVLGVEELSIKLLHANDRYAVFDLRQ